MAAVHAQSIAPCYVDADTLHLWHLDDVGAPVYDSAANKLYMQGLLGGAVLGGAAITNFGSALDTYAGGSDGGILLAAPALANGSGDNVPFTHADPSTGAFTYEALIRFDAGYDPLAQPSGDPRLMQIMSMDNDGTDDRVFQWRYEGRTSTTAPRLVFINISPGAVQAVSVPVPVTGSNAVNNTDWFHVAVTYDGNAGSSDNLKFYWSRLAPTSTNAHLLDTGTLNDDLPVSAADFSIGNEGRATFGSSNGFPGRIDEVRISSIARASDELIPSNADSDHDGMADSWEQLVFGNLDQGATDDYDLDGSDNRTEYLMGTDPKAVAFAAYGGDTNTLHLWHLDETSVPALDSVPTTNTLDLTGVLNGAMLGEEGLYGLGTALNVGTSTGLLLAASALNNGNGDNVPFSFADAASGGFTFEAVIRFDPSYDPVTATNGARMQIISMEGDSADPNRIFQFRYLGRTATSDPVLTFINLGHAPVQGIAISVPTTGDDAVDNINWFHVAVTYNGDAGATNNMQIYWTRMRGGLTNASLIGSATMDNDLLAASGDFAIGNDARDSFGTAEPFVGRIDEVRISSVARTASEMLPSYIDNDSDGLPDWWEVQYFGDLSQGADGNTDYDAQTHIMEYANGTDPTVANDSDSDLDQLPDLWELEHFGSLDFAATGDYDHDTESNLEEYNNGSDPVNPNSVADDVDGDALPDAWEQIWFADILDATAYEDSDGDGYNNVAERAGGTDPQDGASHPSWVSPRVAFLRDTVMATNALLMGNSAGYGRQINGVSFQCEMLATVDGYQYSTWYDTSNTVEKIWLARRVVDGLSAGPWEAFKTDSEFINGDENNWDAHNIISLGIAPDGTLHFAWDHHGNTLRYRSSVPGVCTTNKAAWGTPTMLNAEQSYLVPGNTVTGLTYPMFFNKPTGELFFTYRVGGSTGGDHYLHEYDAAAGTWSDRWMVTSRSGTYTGLLYNGYGSSSSRNPYENGWDFGPDGTLHHTWTCREQADDANHDIHYAYSEDGVVWRNTFGDIIADTSLGQAITINSPGIVVKVLNSRQQLINQQHQCVDNDGRVHVLMYHRRSEPGYEWQPGDGRFGGEDTAYHHYFRDPDTGEWSQRRLPLDVYPVGTRPKIGFDMHGNVYAVFVGSLFLSPTGNGELVVASASKASLYTDWEIVNTISIDFTDSEPLLDQKRLLEDHILSVYVQEYGPSSASAIQTPLHVIDFAVDVPEPAKSDTIALSFNGNDALVNVFGNTGSNYQLQVSTDLADTNGWGSVGSAVGGVDNLIGIPHADGLLKTQSFYRVYSEPAP